MDNYLVAGAGGFIGGHLVKRLRSLKKNVLAIDIKPLEYWFQIFDDVKNYSLDLKDYENCLSVTKDQDYVLNLACNMGGMGFIENNKADCMLSVLINTNLLRASKINKIKKYYFSSSACVYNTDYQLKPNSPALKEEDAYPAMPEDGYGWEKLFSERMCRHFFEDYGLETRVGRYHNVYGPFGTFDGGREKAPAALCRKIIESIKDINPEIEIWGDGKQTRSFLYIDDCIDGTLKLFNSNHRDPLNIGSDELVSINDMVKIIINISKHNKQINLKYDITKPLGVRGRNSDNSKLIDVLKWNYKTNLNEGLAMTYKWISEEINNPNNRTNIFRRS